MRNPDPILREIEVFLATHKMTAAFFGERALGDWRLVQELRGSEERRPRRLWPETAEKVRHFMLTYRPDATRDVAA
jgi:hypothetical protein